MTGAAGRVWFRDCSVRAGLAEQMAMSEERRKQIQVQACKGESAGEESLVRAAERRG
jgi:hypothetical protein